jgi:hypothetical protein
VAENPVQTQPVVVATIVATLQVVQQRAFRPGF